MGSNISRTARTYLNPAPGMSNSPSPPEASANHEVNMEIDSAQTSSLAVSASTNLEKSGVLASVGPEKYFQRRILDYYKPSLPRRLDKIVPDKLSFFDLPLRIRRRIYAYAGLSLGGEVYMNYVARTDSDDEDEAEYDIDLKVENANNEDDEDEYALVDCWEELAESHSCLYFSKRSNDLCPRYYKFWDSEQGRQETEVSAYSKSLSQLLDGLPHPFLRLNRRCPCGRPQKKSSQRSVPAESDSSAPVGGLATSGPVVVSGPVDKPLYCTCVPLPSYLIEVSPRLASEIKSIFFSKNRFSLGRGDVGGLSVLRSLDSWSFLWITSLTIRLNYICSLSEERCMKKHQSSVCLCCREVLPENHAILLRQAKDQQEKAQLLEWKEVCSQIAKCIAPNRLRLSVIAKVESLKAAEEVTAPIANIGILRECSVVLCDFPEKKLVNLASNTILKSTGHIKSSPQAPFRFIDLPTEIQLHVLKFTDLVSPFDIAWSREADGPCGTSYFHFRTIPSFPTIIFRTEPDMDYDCCGVCSSPQEPCYCWTLHSAASTTCKCWKLPGLLFVSGVMRAHALSIFYQYNHFVILPSLRSTNNLNNLRYEPLQFLRSMHVSYLPHLRSITYILPDLESNYYGNNPKFHSDWEEFVDMCARNLNIGKLTLTLDFSLTRRLCEDGFEEMDLDDPEWRDREMGLASRMGSTMTKYEGWRNLFVYLSCQFDDGDILLGDLGDREGAVERMVMGQNYRPYKHGKDDRRHQWNGYPCETYEECEECG